MSVFNKNISSKNLYPITSDQPDKEVHPHESAASKISEFILQTGVLCAASLLIPTPLTPLSLGFAIVLSLTMNLTSSLLKMEEEPSSLPSMLPLSQKLRKLNDITCSGCVMGVFITTNEKGTEKTRQDLIRLPKLDNGCHVGFSGLHNFDIIAYRRSKYGLICDYNPQNTIFVSQVLEIVKNSKTREECVASICAYVQKAQRKYIKIGSQTPIPKVQEIEFSVNILTECVEPTEEIEKELTREGSWLATKEDFQYIKALALSDRIVAINADIRDTHRFKEIEKNIKESELEIDTLYVSNICAYVYDGVPMEKRAFAATARTLMQPQTYLINCPIPISREKSPSIPNQQLFRGSAFQTPEHDASLFLSYEPTGPLDPTLQQEVDELIEELNPK